MRSVTAPVSDPENRAESAGDAEAGVAAPLFRLDPGWLFVLAGLAVCAAGVLLPAQADLHSLRLQLDELRNEEARWYARLKAHSDFVDQVDRGEPELVRRLAATQLNMIPAGETPVLLSTTNTAPVTHWIDQTVKVETSPVKPLPISALSRLANGPDRLWLFAGGIMCVFIGLLMGPGLVRQAQDEQEEALDASDEFALATIEEESAGDDVDGDLLTPDQVQSNILVEVPPAARTMEAKVIPPMSADAEPSPITEGLVPTAKTEISAPPPKTEDQSCLTIANDTDASESDHEREVTVTNQDRVDDAEGDGDRGVDVESRAAMHDDDDDDDSALSDASDESDAKWSAEGRKASNRFEGSDDSRTPSTFE